MFAQDRAGDVCRNSKNGPSAPILGIVTGDPQVTHEKLFDMAHAIIGHQVTIQEFRRRMISEVCNINFEVWGEPWWKYNEGRNWAPVEQLAAAKPPPAATYAPITPFTGMKTAESPYNKKISNTEKKRADESQIRADESETRALFAEKSVENSQKDASVLCNAQYNLVESQSTSAESIKALTGSFQTLAGSFQTIAVGFKTLAEGTKTLAEAQAKQNEVHNAERKQDREDFKQAIAAKHKTEKENVVLRAVLVRDDSEEALAPDTTRLEQAKAEVALSEEAKEQFNNDAAELEALCANEHSQSFTDISAQQEKTSVSDAKTHDDTEQCPVATKDADSDAKTHDDAEPCPVATKDADAEKYIEDCEPVGPSGLCTKNGIKFTVVGLVAAPSRVRVFWENGSYTEMPLQEVLEGTDSNGLSVVLDGTKYTAVGLEADDILRVTWENGQCTKTPLKFLVQGANSKPSDTSLNNEDWLLGMTGKYNCVEFIVEFFDDVIGLATISFNDGSEAEVSPEVLKFPVGSKVKFKGTSGFQVTS